MLLSVDFFTLALNAAAGVLGGAMLGLCSTCIIIGALTLISTSQTMNCYIGCSLMCFGVALLYRIHRRRTMVSTDFSSGKNHAGHLRADETESMLLLQPGRPTYKGGIGSDIMHLPLRYSDSFVLPPSLNRVVNEYIKHAEYAMSVVKLLSGLLTFLLEKENFSKF